MQAGMWWARGAMHTADAVRNQSIKESQFEHLEPASSAYETV